MLTRVRRTGAGTPEDEFRRAVFAACLCWTEEEGTSKIVGLASNKVVRPRLASRVALLHVFLTD